MVREIKINEEKQHKIVSLNSAFDGDQTPVRLTKFNPLSNITTREQASDNQIDRDANNPKGLSASNLLFHSSSKYKTGSSDEFSVNKKRQWYGKSSINTVLGRQELSTREPFQVVWRRLSFEVNPSAYDKLIGRLMDQTRTYWHSNPAKEKDTSGNLDFDETRDQCKKVIFENLNGYVKSGELSAILGPSGSGKTSLLNAICGRIGNYRGSIELIGGSERRMRLSTIPQKDYLMENLTVKENLLFSSRILNTKRHFDHEESVMRVVKMLNLTSCLHSSVSNISGGEYKRVSIAQELLLQPDILILDEPTSGLDSLNCKNLIKSLVQLIEASRVGTIKPIAIVMTIHQPDVDIFQMFDHIYCMARFGRVIFDGHPSNVMNRIDADSGLRLANKSPNAIFSTNPANLLIEIASENLYGQEPIDLLSCIQQQQFEQYFQNIKPSDSPGAGASDTTHNYTKNLNNNSNLLSIIEGRKGRRLNEKNPPICSSISNNNSFKKDEPPLVRDKRLNAKTDHSGQFWYHTTILTKRAFTSALRDPLMTFMSLVFHLSVPFIFWTVYSKRIGSVGACPLIQRDMDMISMVSNNTMGKMEEMQEELTLAVECSTMFFLTTYSLSMCSLSIAALAFPLNMHILLKEVRNGWYNLPSYVVAKTIATFPFEVLFPVISLVMIYLMLDMPSSYLDWRLWGVALVMGLIALISHTHGLIFGALCMDSVQTAIFLASASTLPQTLLSGFTARIRHMPILLQKLSWLSQYRYSSDAINIIRFGFGICPCDDSTDEYLRTKETSFTDVPSQMKPLFTYYLTNVAAAEQAPIEFNNGTNLAENSTLGSFVASNHLDNTSYLEKYPQIPGISYDLTLNSTARSRMIKMIENNELDLFGRMADMMARSFTFGRAMDNCDTVRSELLATTDAPKDGYLFHLLAGMLALLAVSKLVLFLIVKFKIGSRI